jgi:hypothetical protein
MHERRRKARHCGQERKGVVRLHGAEPRKAMQERCGVAPGVRRALADAIWICRGEALHRHVDMITAMVVEVCW